MLKNPYVSRVFGHLFDLVRTVKRLEMFKTIWILKTSTPLTLHLIRNNISPAFAGLFLYKNKAI